MDFSLTDDQQALADLAGRILGDHGALERLKELERSTEWIDRDAWGALAGANLLGTALPEEHGGLGYGFLELCLVLEQQGRHVNPLPLLTDLVAAAAIAEWGTPEQQKVLGSVAAGDTLLTLALEEQGAEPDAPGTTATRAGAGWRLDGVKVSVPSAHLADALLVPARTDGGAVAVFLVPAGAPGVDLARQETVAHEPRFVATLTGVEVGDDAVLGGVDRGAAVVAWIVARATVGLCAMQAGVCERALRITAEYTTNRKQFERPIATFQAVGQRLADAYIDVEAIRLTMLQAATHLAEGREVPLEVATAKYWSSEGAHRVGHAALHCHGGISIDVDYPIHRYFLWAKQIEFTLGAGTPQLARIGKALAAS